jgi:hypothetical protein
MSSLNGSEDIIATPMATAKKKLTFNHTNEQVPIPAEPTIIPIPEITILIQTHIHHEAIVQGKITPIIPIHTNVGVKIYFYPAFQGPLGPFFFFPDSQNAK